MTDDKIRRKTQRALDHSLRGLNTDPFLALHTLSRAKEGEKPMLKKLSGSLIFAVVLVLLMAATAFAITNWDELKAYFETVREMDAEGALARWSDEDKIRLLEAMDGAGLLTPEDGDLETAMDESLPLEQRGAAANAVISAHYGDNYFTSHTVEQIEFPEAARTAEEQAIYEQWSQQSWAAYSAQEKTPLTESKTYRETMNHLTEIGDFPVELIRDVRVSGNYDEKAELWTITAAINRETYLAAGGGSAHQSVFDSELCGFRDGDDLCFQFWLDPYGNYLGFHEINAPENRAELTLEQAQALAEKAVKVRLNVDAAALSRMECEAGFGESGEYDLAKGRFNASAAFIWRDNGEARYHAEIDAVTGRVLSAFDWRESDAMRERERAWIADIQALLKQAGVSDELTNAQGEFFYRWPVAQKAAWSQVARPVVQDYLARNEDFRRYLEDLLAGKYAQSEWPMYISLTQYAYGTPDEQAISQEEAFAIARAAAIEQGASERYVDDNQGHAFYYDVTDPLKPLWKVHISLMFGDEDKEHPYDAAAPWGYFVVIDAHTGEILTIDTRTVNTEIRELV